jgi:hypothetical protein
VVCRNEGEESFVVPFSLVEGAVRSTAAELQPGAVTTDACSAALPALVHDENADSDDSDVLPA